MWRRRITGLGLASLAGLAGCGGSGSGKSLADYCAAIDQVRGGSLIPDDMTDKQAVAEARRTLEDLAKRAPSDIADEIDVLRKAMTAIGAIDFDRADASDQVEKVLNDSAVDDAAGKVGQFTETACGAATPNDDAG